MKDLIKIGKVGKYLFFIGLFFTLVLGVTRSYMPMFVEYLVDSVLGSQDPKLPDWIVGFVYHDNYRTHLLFAAAGLAVFAVFRGLVMIVNAIFKAKFSEKIAMNMRNNMYEHLQNLPYQFHNDADTGDLIQRCTTDIDTIRMFFQNHVFSLFWIASLAVGVVIQMLRINVSLTFISLMVLPITVAISVYYFKKIEKVFIDVEEAESSLTTTVQENLNGVRVVKAFSNEAFEIEKFHEKNEVYRKKSLKMYDKMANYWSISDFITINQYLITLTVGIFYSLNGLLTIGELLAFVMLVQIIVWPIRNLGRIVAEYSKTVVSISRLEKIFSLEDEYTHDGTFDSGIDGGIEFKDVSFKFEDTDAKLIDGMSFKIAQGETIALVGKTGSGKSTLVKLLVRLLDHTDGDILIDGKKITEYKKRYLRDSIGVILQEPFLFGKSVEENIGITLAEHSEKRVRKAAQLASIDTDISNFENGYNTLVGEKGVTLSGGQKQRVAIARLLINQKPIMVFDDSLSALDTETDLSIRQALRHESGNTTMIIITHRITTAMEADRIMVLEKGKIVQNDTHTELIKKDGLYKNLYEIQAGLEQELKKQGGGM